MKTAFNIKFRPEIEAGKFKVVTADGRPVTIQRWDMKGNYPILACTMVKQCNWDGDESWDEERPFAYDKDGHAAGTAPADKLELFVISEHPELTEFEGKLKTIVNTYSRCGDYMSDEGARNIGKTLLDTARKQMTIDAEEVSLTWKDVRLFESVLEEMLGDRIYGICSSGISNEQYSKEVLRRFKELKRRVKYDR